MMTKRDYITIFLEKVKEIWEPARGFLVLMRYNILNEEQTEDLFQVFKSVVQSSSDEMKKRKLQRAILAVENLRNQEKTETTLNQDLDQILSEI
mgnify:FL=1|jgi:hypothetical protein